jgi:hypothetical protein
MKIKTAFRFGNAWRRLLPVVAALSLIATFVPVGTASADTSVTAGTGYQVQINETFSRVSD